MSLSSRTYSSNSSNHAKKKSISLNSARARTQATQQLSDRPSRRNNSTPPASCLFCQKKASKPKVNYFPIMINRALYSKYSSSQNYYFTKDINEILANARTQSVIKFKDYTQFDEQEEYLKRFYRAKEYPTKIQMLTEYYKFHKDISRLFMLPVVHVVNKFHDKKRRLEYIRVTKMLKEEEAAKTPRSKRDQEKRIKDNLSTPITNRILHELDHHDPLFPPYDHSQNLKKLTSRGGNSSFELPKNNKKESSKHHHDTGYGNSKAHHNVDNSRADVSISNTIQDLNSKLGDIINSRVVDGNYFEGNNDQGSQQNDTITGLAQFLNYMKKDKGTHERGPGIHNIDPIQPQPVLIGGANAKIKFVSSKKSQNLNIGTGSTHEPKILQGHPAPKHKHNPIQQQIPSNTQNYSPIQQTNNSQNTTKTSHNTPYGSQTQRTHHQNLQRTPDSVAVRTSGGLQAAYQNLNKPIIPDLNIPPKSARETLEDQSNPQLYKSTSPNIVKRTEQSEAGGNMNGLPNKKYSNKENEHDHPMIISSARLQSAQSTRTYGGAHSSMGSKNTTPNTKIRNFEDALKYSKPSEKTFKIRPGSQTQRDGGLQAHHRRASSGTSYIRSNNSTTKTPRGVHNIGGGANFDDDTYSKDKSTSQMKRTNTSKSGIKNEENNIQQTGGTGSKSNYRPSTQYSAYAQNLLPKEQKSARNLYSTPSMGATYSNFGNATARSSTGGSSKTKGHQRVQSGTYNVSSGKYTASSSRNPTPTAATGEAKGTNFNIYSKKQLFQENQKIEMPKKGYHKYTKSEGKLQQADNILKSSLKNEDLLRSSNKNLNINYNNAVQQQQNAAMSKPGSSHHQRGGSLGSGLQSSGAKGAGNAYTGASSKDASPHKKVYTYNHNNIVNIFLSHNQEKNQNPSGIFLKSDDQRYPKQQVGAGITEVNPSDIIRVTSPTADVILNYGGSHEPIKQKAQAGTKKSNGSKPSSRNTSAIGQKASTTGGNKAGSNNTTPIKFKREEYLKLGRGKSYGGVPSGVYTATDFNKVSSSAKIKHFDFIKKDLKINH